MRKMQRIANAALQFLIFKSNAARLGSDKALSRVKTAGKIEEIGVLNNLKPAGRYCARPATGHQAKSANSTATDSGQDE